MGNIYLYSVYGLLYIASVRFLKFSVFFLCLNIVSELDGFRVTSSKNSVHGFEDIAVRFPSEDLNSVAIIGNMFPPFS